MDNFTPEMNENLVQYLDGELSGTEKDLLEQQLATDKNLQAALTSLQTTREAVRLYGLKQKIAAIHPQMMEAFKAPVKQINSRRKILRYAVAIAASVVIFIGGYMAYNYYSLTPEKVFASNFQSYELVTNRDISRGESEIVSNYKEQNYAAAIAVVIDSNATTEDLFVRGLAFTELRNNDSAIGSFKKVLETNKTATKPVYNDEAEYYLALMYLRNKDYDNALALLNKIEENPDHLYHEKVSAKLIRNVKMLKKR